MTAGATPGARLADFEARLAQLEERVGAVPPSTARLPGPDTNPARVRLGPAALDEIGARLAKLEAAEAVRVAAAQARRRQQDSLAAKQRVQSARTIAQSNQTILDPRSGERDKVLAWRRLRPFANEAWTDALIREMVRIGHTSTDQTLRTDVWRQSKANATHPLLTRALLRALVDEPVARVRVEVAETLENYVREPGVASALQSARQNDDDQRVRAQAKRSLDRGMR